MMAVMRIGIFDADTPSFESLDEVIACVAAAEQAGLAAYWLWHAANRDALTALAVAGREVPRIELGVNVVAT